MSFSKPRVLILGHSFIRRLENDINSPHKPWLHVNVGLEQCDTCFAHEGGWKISPNYKTFLDEVREKLRSLSPSFSAVVVQIGGNDLCLQDCKPIELASKIEDFAQWILHERIAKVVYVCELFARSKPRGVDPEVYESRRLAVNNYLGTLLEESGHVKFWRHRRIFNSPQNIFISDGTHLNDVGTKKFYESLKRCTILAEQLASLV